MTIRDMVADIQREVLNTDLSPDRASVLLTKLTALLGNVLAEIREADQLYAETLLKCLESEEKANRAKIRAECSPEFQRKREARDTRELVEALVGSLKYLLRSFEAEMRMTR